MKLTLKNLQQQTFTIDVEPSISIAELKSKIEKEKGEKDYPAGGQKLIYGGKIMNDDNTLESYSVDVKKFVVVMVTKVKTSSGLQQSTVSDESVKSDVSADKPETSSTQSSSVKSEAVTKTESESSSDSSKKSKEESKNDETLSTKSNENKDESSSSSAKNDSGVLTGTEYDSAIDNIVSMGYTKDKVIEAMRASFNNPERAVEYLISGIPSSLTSSSSSGHSGSASAQPPSSEEERESSSSGSALDFLRSQPQFQQMKTLIRSNPAMLNSLLENIGETNPELLQLITENQQDFIRMVNESVTEEEEEGDEGEQTSQSDEISNTGSSQQASGDPRTVLRVSGQDMEAIERLKALGFAEALVVQAYFACDKNENAAANLLLSNMDD